MNQLQILCSMAICVVVSMLVFSVVLRFRRRRRYLEYSTREETRAKFARARRELELLTIQQKISPKSEIFEFLYSIQTYVMRRPDHFEGIAEHMATAMNLESDHSVALQENVFERLNAELSCAPAELGGVIRSTIEAFEYLADEYRQVGVVEQNGVRVEAVAYVRELIELLSKLLSQLQSQFGDLAGTLLTTDEMQTA